VAGVREDWDDEEGQRYAALIGEDGSHQQETIPDEIRSQFDEIPFSKKHIARIE
jgi:hypothetical protein